jgi:hypothetical protein
LAQVEERRGKRLFTKGSSLDEMRGFGFIDYDYEHD